MTDISNYRIVEVRDAQGRLVGHRHESDATPATFLRPSVPRKDDRDEWGVGPTQQPKGPDFRGHGIRSSDDEPTGSAPGPNLSTAERGAPTADPGAVTRAAAFSGQRIPAADLANAMVDPDLGQTVIHAMAIDLAHRRVGQDVIDRMLAGWGRDHPDVVRTIDLSAEAKEVIDMIDLASETHPIDLATEEAAWRFLLSDEDRPWDEAIDLSSNRAPVIIDL